MTQRAKAPAGAPTWIDLMTSDPERVRAFYGELFGWTSTDPDPDYGGYINFLKDAVPVAGCMQNQPEFGTPDVWSVYLASADAKATGDAAEAHGGAVVVPAMDVMDLGRMAVVTDPGGASSGVGEPRAHPGFGVLDEPGAPGWFELHTRDYEPTLAFYRDVFGWDVHTAADTPGFRYSTLGEGEGQLAGIMDAGGDFLPEGVPAHWSVYFGVESADASIETTVRVGGSVVQPAEDTPYGRMATVADPTGAVFKLIQR